MIATITLNASIDKFYELSSPLNLNQVNRVTTLKNTAGGKGLNAARAVFACNESIIASGLKGGYNGQLLCKLLDEDGITHKFATTQNETRCCINAVDSTGSSTEILEPGAFVSKPEYQEFLDIYDQILDSVSVVTLNGSLPKGLDVQTTYADLIKRAHNKGVFCILDTSGDCLKHAVAAKPDMIKPNSDEIAQLLNTSVSSIDDVIERAKQLHADGILYVVVSLGKDGALMVCESGVYRGYPAKITVKNPVGAGDTLVGTFAVGIKNKREDSEVLRFAMACASANCLSEKTGSFEMDAARELYEQTIVEKIG